MRVSNVLRYEGLWAWGFESYIESSDLGFRFGVALRLCSLRLKKSCTKTNHTWNHTHASAAGDRGLS